MLTIYKYPLNSAPEQSLNLPQDAKLLSIQFQQDILCLWALVDTDKPMEELKLFKIGTGWELGEPLGNYIATIQHGPFVWHYFAWRS